MGNIRGNKLVPLVMVGAVLLSLFAVVPAEDAEACSCAPGPTDLERFQNADYVFLGTVIDVVPDGPDFDDDKWGVFRVDEAYKVPKDTVWVRTSAHSGICGLSFPIGAQYLVYANLDDEGRASAYSCGGTRRTEFAELPPAGSIEWYATSTTLPSAGPANPVGSNPSFTG